jgi:hypothetical protein
MRLSLRFAVDMAPVRAEWEVIEQAVGVLGSREREGRRPGPPRQPGARGRPGPSGGKLATLTAKFREDMDSGPRIPLKK